MFTSTETYKGNNTSNLDDISGLNTIRETTAEENSLIDEIRKLREKDDRSLFNRILQLEDQLEALNPNSVSRRTDRKMDEQSYQLRTSILHFSRSLLAMLKYETPEPHWSHPSQQQLSREERQQEEFG